MIEMMSADIARAAFHAQADALKSVISPCSAASASRVGK
jgi:hypothetical protein